jgi:hypothetical protein
MIGKFNSLKVSTYAVRYTTHQIGLISSGISVHSRAQISLTIFHILKHILENSLSRLYTRILVAHNYERRFRVDYLDFVFSRPPFM